MNALESSFKQSHAVANAAYDRAVRMKAEGLLSEQIAPATGFGQWQSRAKDTPLYGMFRAWLYSAVNALASEAAGQAVNVGRLGDAKSMPKSMKSYYLGRMTAGASRKAAGEGLEIITDHPLLNALENPNPIQYRWQFVYNFVANLNLTGWAFIVGEKTKEGGMRFYSVPTTWVRPDHSDGPFSKFRIVNPEKPQASQNDKPLGRESVAFAHLPNPSDPLSAMAPAASQYMAIRIDDHIQTSQEAFFENGIFPSTIITIGKNPLGSTNAGERPKLTFAQRRQVEGAIGRVMKGVRNYGNPAILDGMIDKIERWSATQNEMGWEKSEPAARTRILSAFGVHPFILGEPVGVGGYAQSTKIEERFCKRVNTFLDMLGNVMTNFTAPMTGEGEKLLVWWDKCTPVDPALRSREMQEARKIGDVTRNENRAYLGLPPAEEEEATRSKLLDTVGGMTGANQLLKSLGEGFVSREAAVQLFVKFFQVSEQEARKMVGGEKAVTEQAIQTLQVAVEEMRKPITVDLAGDGMRMLTESVAGATE